MLSSLFHRCRRYFDVGFFLAQSPLPTKPGIGWLLGVFEDIWVSILEVSGGSRGTPGEACGCLGEVLGTLGSILGVLSPKKPPRIPKERPKSSPRRPQEAPRGPRRPPKGSQETPKKAQEAPKTPPKQHQSLKLQKPQK